MVSYCRQSSVGFRSAQVHQLTIAGPETINTLAYKFI